MNLQIDAKLRATGQETMVQAAIHLHDYGQNCLHLYRLPTTYRSVNLLADNVSHGAQERGLHRASRTPPAQSDSYKGFLSSKVK